MTTAPGVAPAVVEGSCSSRAVVGVRGSGDHTTAGPVPSDLTPYELTAGQCVELAALLREAAGAIGPSPSPLTDDLERWADSLMLTEVVE